ncbi:MAG: Histone deacetylase-like amidohydrolase [Chloroflexi bacterium ADurb.Bin325]|nr:MAG: Histone deacetylase-like amidohydrolase [Chloroflexi bacterium ADurb.Bin325]
MRAATGYVYDPLFLEHDLPGHPEGRARLTAILAELASVGLLARMQQIPARPADDALLGRVHDPAYIERVRRISARGGGYLDPDTYLVGDTDGAARLAAGGAVELTRAVLRGELRNGIALVRPPGHHAERGRGMGFCIFNNIAVAAQAALDEFGLGRVLILDWDVHHGNGTQDIFYDSSEVMFISTHQYPYYPGTGDWRETGRAAGRGCTANIPLPAGVGDAGFRRLFDEAVVPLAERFRPELILVSAGYDAHWKDPLAGLHLSLAGYWRLATDVVGLAERLCGGRLVVVLEGGYNLPILAAGVADACRALLRDAGPGADPAGAPAWPETSVDRALYLVRKEHAL